jgi:hypothetical protein
MAKMEVGALRLSTLASALEGLTCALKKEVTVRERFEMAS